MDDVLGFVSTAVLGGQTLEKHIMKFSSDSIPLGLRNHSQSNEIEGV